MGRELFPGSVVGSFVAAETVRSALRKAVEKAQVWVSILTPTSPGRPPSDRPAAHRSAASARMTRGAFSLVGATQMSISPVARGRPCAPRAYAPTRRNWTSSADNADNISAKSGFSNVFSHNGPGVLCDQPHHLEAGLRSPGHEIVVRRPLACAKDAYRPVSTIHQGHSNRLLVDEVLLHVPYRQWVITFPRWLPIHLATDHALNDKVGTLAIREIFRWLRKKARKLPPTRITQRDGTPNCAR